MAMLKKSKRSLKLESKRHRKNSYQKTEADFFLVAGAGPWNRSFVQLSEDEDKCQDNYAYKISENNHQ